MKRESDFSADVIRVLAGRAGYTCSICKLPTSGPGAAPEIVINDGIAAHITAASKNGPRYDDKLSPSQRRSADNGIWVCTKCAREIDSAHSTFSVESLRGLKRIHEDWAALQLRRRANPSDPSALLIEFPYVETANKLFDIIRPQSYNYQTASALHELIIASPAGARALNLAPDVIIGTWDTHPNVAGILSTLLCNAIELWHPTPEVLTKLQGLCRSAVEADDWSRVASVEPLAFAIAAQGSKDMQAQILERIVFSTNWRKQDVERVREYYGTQGVELGAIIRHWRDPLRKGLLRANDVGRLMDLMFSNDKLIQTAGRRDLVNLLLEHAKVLSEGGAPELARSVADFVVAFELLGTSPRAT